MRARSLLMLVCVAAMGLLLQMSAARASNVLVVDDDGFGDAFNCDGSTAAFTTIQAAVDAAASDDFIVVCSGSYGESVTVPQDKPRLRILGAQMGVDARTRSVGAENESVVDPPTGPAFSLLASNTVLDGFTIQGAEDSPGIYTSPDRTRYKIQNDIITGNVFGVYLNSAGVDNTLVRFCRFADNNEPGAASGNAIYTDQGLSNVKIHLNLFSGHTNSAILFAFVDGVQNSTILISANKSVDDANFVSLFSASQVNIVSNRTADTTSVDDASQGSAIRVGGQTSDVLIQDNILGHSAFSGIAVRDDGLGTGVANIGVLGNLVFAAEEDGLDVTSAMPAVVHAVGNKFKNNGVDGIFLDSGTSDDAMRGNTALGNGTFDCHDLSVGSRPTGTANIWRNDVGASDDPATLCTPPA